MLSDPGANAALSPDDLPHDLFVPGAHLHVSGYTLLSEGAQGGRLAAIDYARRTNMTVVGADAASGRPAGAGRGRALPRAVLRGRAAVRQRRPGHGAHRPGATRSRRPVC